MGTDLLTSQFVPSRALGNRRRRALGTDVRILSMVFPASRCPESAFLFELLDEAVLSWFNVQR